MSYATVIELIILGISMLWLTYTMIKLVKDKRVEKINKISIVVVCALAYGRNVYFLIDSLIKMFS